MKKTTSFTIFLFLLFCTTIMAQAPVAVDDVLPIALIEDGADGSINILLNDTDPNGNPTPTSGHLVDVETNYDGIQNYGYFNEFTVIYNTDSGVLTIMPYDNANGNFSFQYRIIDNVDSTLSSTATVSFSVTSVFDPPTAVNDQFGYSIPSCFGNGDYQVLQNDYADNGVDYSSLDLNPAIDGIQTNFVLMANQVNLGEFFTNGNGYIDFNPANPFFTPNTTYQVNYTFKDGLGATSNVGTYTLTITISNPNLFINTNSYPTCDDSNGGSVFVRLEFFGPGGILDNFQFELYGENVLVGSYTSTDFNGLTLTGLSAGNYSIQNLRYSCGIFIPIFFATNFSVYIQNPLIGIGTGVYQDFNNDGIVNVGDVVNQQFEVTNTSTACTLTNVTLGINDPLYNITSQPIPTLVPSATNSNSITGTQVLTQENINAGFVQTYYNFITSDIPVGYGNTQTFVINTPLNTSNGIKLNAFIDTNGNGTQEDSEMSFNRGNFSYTINGGEEHIINASSGAFYLYESNPATLYNLQYDINPNSTYCDGQYTVTTAAYNNVTVANDSGITTYNFAITTVPCTDVEVLVLQNNRPRPGFVYQNTIAIRNNGNQLIEAGTVTFTKDDAVAITSVTPTATTTNANGFTYNFAYLYPYETRYITVAMQMPTIPAVSLGQLVTNSATVSLPVADASMENNSATLTQTIVGSFDPNEKSEAHGGKIVHSSFTADDYLTYTILFENTGTAEAINVRVEDVLEDKLDETTVRMVRSNSNYVLDRIDSNLAWRFDGINLPPSNGSATIGHGEITFQVKPKAGYAIGDSISNTANIYFDFNPPITTDPCVTEFVAALGNENFVFNDFKYFPNPVNNMFSIVNRSIIDEIELTSILGQNIMTQKVNDLQAELDFSTLKSGVYFVKITSKSVQKTIKVVKE